MAKPAHKLIFGINLLKPQSEPKKVTARALGWVFSAGRFLIVFVEVLVLVAFLARFKFDADIQAAKEAIAQQVPFVESLKADETLIRKTQFQLATIKTVRSQTADYNDILQKISAQTPAGISLSNLNLEVTTGKTNLKVTGTARTNADLTTFFLGMKEDKSFTDINLANIELGEGLINFSLTGTYLKGDKSL